MFTVLLAEREHIEAIQQANKLFFEPFLENKDLAFCEWNPSGQNLQDSAPELLDIVGRRGKWRAIIINNCTPASLKSRNPFDVVDATALASLEEPSRQLDISISPDKSEDQRKLDYEILAAELESKWKSYYELLTAEQEAIYKSALEFPLQKLATWLCFKPEDYILTDVAEKQDVQDWAMEQIKGDNLNLSDRLELLERNQYKKTLRMKEQIRRDFLAEKYLNVAFPSEVLCISIRSADNGFFDPDSFWNVRLENEYSTFADRNMYFDKMRFLIADLLPRTHRNHRNDYIRFLASVLILATNPVPSGAMQARRLYRMEVETDDTPLCTLVTSYDKKLAATSAVIETEMDKIRSEIPEQLTDKVAQALFCTAKDVDVSLGEDCNPERVSVETDYGLFYDHPEDEMEKWKRSKNASVDALMYIIKQQARTLRKSVGQMHRTSEVSEVDISRLTSSQMDDIREFTDAAEDEMIACIPSNLEDISRYTEQIDRASGEVRKQIRRRMTRKTALILTAVCLGLYFACCLPFLLSNGGSTRVVATAITLSVGMVVAMGIALFVCLLLLRASVRNAINAYNSTVQKIAGEIRNSMKRFSKYLSAISNVRRGHAVQNYAQKNLDEYTKSLRIRKRHLEDIRKRRAFLSEEYGDYFGDKLFLDETMSRPYEYDFDLKTEYEYPAPFLAGDHRQVEFVSNGNYVTVPSSYVTSIVIRMEGIYDK